MKIKRENMVKIDIEMTSDELSNVMVFYEFALENCMAEMKACWRDGGQDYQDIAKMERDVSEFYERL